VTVLDDIRVIDTDTHVTESPDLWTSRMSARKWGDAIPHLARDEASGEDCWYIGGRKVIPVGMTAPAGHTDYVPHYPKTWDDLEPASYDANERLAMMDRYRIDKQILFANVALFAHKALDGGAEDKRFIFECIQAYNDFQTDWCSAAPSRLIPMTQIPFWDVEGSIEEMARGAEMGHKGVVITQEPAAFGLPPLRSTHWDRLWAAAQDMGQPVNFHIASADIPEVITSLGEKQDSTYNVTNSVCIINGNLRTLGELTAGGICHRFPRLNFVLVESGFGWIPWALEAYDWQWKTHGVARNHPYDLLPSEYFKRQIYGSFWFEDATAMHALEQIGDDNVFWETDYPHPTSMSPGPASPAPNPDEYIRDTLAHLPEPTLRKILHDNAARVYHLD
jgi:predicted TIM-barrel fold metal-dependent hydrolase